VQESSSMRTTPSGGWHGPNMVPTALQERANSRRYAIYILCIKQLSLESGMIVMVLLSLYQPGLRLVPLYHRNGIGNLSSPRRAPRTVVYTIHDWVNADLL